MSDYRIVVEYSPEDEAYVALVPSLPGCMADGRSPEKALAAAKEAAALWLEVAKEEGREIPLPDWKRTYSGKIPLRMPPQLHRSLAQNAEAEGLSLNKYMVAVLATVKKPASSTARSPRPKVRIRQGSR